MIRKHSGKRILAAVLSILLVTGSIPGLTYRAQADNAKPITDSMISLEPDFFEYDGKEHSPELTVKDGEIVLKENTDYMVTAQDSTKATGDYTVTVEGIGAYTGSASASWCIKDTTPPTVLGVADGDKCESPVSFSVTDTDEINLWNVTLENDKETWEIKPYFDFLDKSGVWIGYFSIDLDPGIYTIIAPDEYENKTTVTFTILDPGNGSSEPIPMPTPVPVSTVPSAQASVPGSTQASTPEPIWSSASENDADSSGKRPIHWRHIWNVWSFIFYDGGKTVPWWLFPSCSGKAVRYFPKPGR